MTDERHLSTRDIAEAAARRRDIERELDHDVSARTSTAAPPLPGPDGVNVHPHAHPDLEPERELALFPHEELDGFRTRWEAIQTGFVDEPKAAVEEADALVAQVVTRLADVFSKEREALERQWDKGTDVSTEDLRQSLKRYRSFFNRLLSV